jgi:imidazolonepropionase
MRAFRQIDRQVNRVTLWRNANIATFAGMQPWGWIEDGAMLTRDEAIVWVGAASDLPRSLAPDVGEERDLLGACVTPALVDCHTHLVYAGSRAREFELRLQGASYEDIANAGGGIRSTVAATRSATEAALLQGALARATALMREGVAMIEIKSGYGLTEHDEARSLRVARSIPMHLPIKVSTTYLAAHALPDEFSGRADDYIDAVCDWLPRLHAQGLVDAVDAFCDRIGFTVAQTQRVFDVARALALPVKLHAEQLSDQNGAALAASYAALSCDHLEYVSAEGVIAMANAGTIAVLLPGAYYFLRETQSPPVALLKQHGVPIALATDHNPGSSPTLSPLLMMNMACTLFRLTPEEAWRGFTINAARALGVSHRRGQLRQGMRADFAVWNTTHPRELVYQFGHRSLQHLVCGGTIASI